jgi:hypothetical protein
MPAAKIVATAMKKYGLVVADNGGNWFISGAPDDRMPDDEINALKGLKGSDFEAVVTVDGAGKPILPGSGIRPRLAARRIQAGNGEWFNSLGRRVEIRKGLALSSLMGGSDAIGNPGMTLTSEP